MPNYQHVFLYNTQMIINIFLCGKLSFIYAEIFGNFSALKSQIADDNNKSTVLLCKIAKSTGLIFMSKTLAIFKKICYNYRSYEYRLLFCEIY